MSEPLTDADRPLTVAEARAARVCRVCRKPVRGGGRVTLDFGREYAHAACLPAAPEVPTVPDPLPPPTDAELPDMELWLAGRPDVDRTPFLRLLTDLRAARADLAACREALAECRRAAFTEAAYLARREAEAYRRNAALCDRTGNAHGGTVDTACSLACERVAGVIGARLTAPPAAAASPACESPGAAG